MTLRPLLVDAELDAALAVDGFAVLPLLDDQEVAELRRRSRALEHHVTTDRSFAAGFHATIIDDRADYRRAAHQAIVDVVAPHVARIGHDLEVVMTNWLHKAPGAAPVPNHVDWTFVDESEHRSISIWVPLCDTDEGSGAIGVLAGSHRVVDFIRAAAHPTYQETDAFGAALPGRQVLALRAGECVVFDHRLVHFSTGHGGPDERLAITLELVPAEAEVLHFEQVEPGRFRRHVVSDAFFEVYAAGQDPTKVAGHRAVTEVTGRSFDPSSSIGAPATIR